jgi:hypothetical protein
MIRRLRSLVTYANVAATLAVFLAVAGGSAFALEGRNTVDSGDIIDGEVATADLGGSAVTSAKIKDGRVRAQDLAPAEAFHVVGQRGEPALLNGGQGDCLWRSRANATPLPFNPPSFYKDPYGVVHLAGALTVVDGPGGDGRCDVAAETDDERIFVLPPGYRPARVEVHAVQGGPGGSVDGEDAVFIGPAQDVVAGGETLPAGTVFVAADPTGVEGATGAYFLDGISFRAATDPEAKR